MGENFIGTIPLNAFNNTLKVNDLKLDYNYIEELQEGVFKSLMPRRVYLGMNRIKHIDKNAFQGVEDTLELFDMERNKLNNISEAFNQLKNLRYLYISNNNISTVRVDAFSSFSETLRALSLSGNHISTFPRDALRLCTELSHLNIGYNDIKEVVAQDFLGWASKIDTLILR
jgi:Leucine-rich repeat (LRR) protein